MIPLVWRGLGWLVPLMMIPAILITHLFLGDRSSSKLGSLLVYSTAGALCVVASFFVDAYRKSTTEVTILRNETTGKERKKRVVVKTNIKTGEQYVIEIKDTFFGIPIIFWSVIFAMLGLYIYWIK